MAVVAEARQIAKDLLIAWVSHQTGPPGLSDAAKLGEFLGTAYTTLVKKIRESD